MARAGRRDNRRHSLSECPIAIVQERGEREWRVDVGCGDQVRMSVAIHVKQYQQRAAIGIELICFGSRESTRALVQKNVGRRRDDAIVERDQVRLLVTGSNPLVTKLSGQ